MKNKVVLITGGNSGIGKETALGLANMGAKIVLICRNRPKAHLAVEEIQQKTGNPGISYMIADFSSLEDIKKVADDLNSTLDRLDVVINNAGTVVNKLMFTNEGYELQFGVNHLAHFALTLHLLPLLKAAPAARVINVASKAHYSGKIDFENLMEKEQNYSGLSAYSRSKLANVLFTRELAKRLEGTEITANCLHPGVVRTQIGNKSNWLFSLVWTIYKPFMITAKKGARTSVYLASSAEVENDSGRYYDEHQKVKWPSKVAQDDALAQRLWEYSEEATGLKL